MKLILRREQRKGMLGKMIFALSVRADISPEDVQAIQQYKLGGAILYEDRPLADRGKGLLGLASRMVHHMTNMSVSVHDLTYGKVIECKDVVEMLAVEEQLREAAKTFSNILNAAKHFGGDEVIDLAA